MINRLTSVLFWCVPLLFTFLKYIIGFVYAFVVSIIFEPNKVVETSLLFTATVSVIVLLLFLLGFFKVFLCYSCCRFLLLAMKIWICSFSSCRRRQSCFYCLNWFLFWWCCFRFLYFSWCCCCLCCSCFYRANMHTSSNVAFLWCGMFIIARPYVHSRYKWVKQIKSLQIVYR